MRKILIFMALAVGQLIAQNSPQRNSYGPSTQGATFAIPNTAGSQAVSFEYLFNNTPAAVSITIQGCMRGSSPNPGNVGTCDAATDTYTGTSNSIRSPSFTKVYDTFLITIGTLSAGTNLTVNTTVVVSKAGTSGSGGGSATPGGSNTQVQYNNAGVFGGATGVTTNGVSELDVGLNGGATGVLGFNGSTSGKATCTAPAVAGTITNPVTCTNSLALPAGGTASTPALIVGSGGNIYQRAANIVDFAGSTNPLFEMGFFAGNGGYFEGASQAVIIWTSGALGAGADTGLSRTAPAIVAVGNGSASGDETGFLREANPCRVSADITLPVNTATTICSWALPAIAKTWGWQCQLPWAITAGTGTNTIAISVNYTQTPTGATGTETEIKTTNTNTATELWTALSATGSTTLLTSPTITPNALPFESSTSGTLLASATAGTLSIQMTAAGTTATAVAKAGATCYLY